MPSQYPPPHYRYAQFQPRRPAAPPPRPPASRKLLRAVLLVILLGGVLFVGDKVWKAAPVQRIFAQHLPKQQPLDVTGLKASVDTIIAANPSVKIAVATIDIKTNTVANFGSSDAFVAASTAKVITAACFLHNVEAGKDTLNEQINGYTAQFQLQQMINRSNNDSWDALTKVVGLQNLGNYAHSNELKSYDIDDNTLTAADEALLLEKIYQGKLLNKSHTSLLLGYMQHTNDDSMIPAAVPAGVTVYHKYGLLNGNLHDAAVVVASGRPMVVVVYTNAANLSDEDARVATIQDITRKVVTFYGSPTGASSGI